jgi:3-deoxy-D-manno-octulosonate 8-phosphate phosphatase (KDO 8-P phosphatase)
MSRQDPLSAEDGANIRLLALDVDGVLTDSQLYFGNDGEELKSFSTLDGQGIKLLQEAGIVVALITARESALVARRAANLGIHHVYQGRHDKLTALHALTQDLALDLAQVAYIGDDLPDLACIRRVGLGITVPNGHGSVKQYARMITAARGGQGAVREVCDFLLKSQGLYEKAIAPYL